MGKINSRSKGQRAERAAIDLLQPVVNECYAALGYKEHEVPMLQRNTLQSQAGGFDVVGLEWLALEVKHQETLLIEQWWLQTIKQAKKANNGQGAEPVLMYKQNNVRFRVRMQVHVWVHRSDGGQWHIVDVSIESFVEYFKARLMAELTCKANGSRLSKP